MVLPWITDKCTPAFMKGRLSCPFYDDKDEMIRFAVDQRYSLNIKNSRFYMLNVFLLYEL